MNQLREFRNEMNATGLRSKNYMGALAWRVCVGLRTCTCRLNALQARRSVVSARVLLGRSLT